MEMQNITAIKFLKKSNRIRNSVPIFYDVFKYKIRNGNEKMENQEKSTQKMFGKLTKGLSILNKIKENVK